MGARYCPSIEDKVKKFSSKNHHQIFLEPEGLKSDIIYPNGISTSLPQDIQLNLISSFYCWFGKRRNDKTRLCNRV